MLLLGIGAVSFSQIIIEDILEVERAFGEEPLSLSYIRAGLVCALAGAALLLYGGWRNRKGAKNEG